MVADIHARVEQQDDDGTWHRVEWPGDGPFDLTDYSVFAFLAGVRNYAAVPPIAEPRGLPENTSIPEAHDGDLHSHSWLRVSELADFDYARTFENRRAGGRTTERGEVTTYREFLGAAFFHDLATLSAMNALRPTRVVFWFDN